MASETSRSGKKSAMLRWVVAQKNVKIFVLVLKIFLLPGPAVLLAAQPVPADDPRAARRDAAAAHLHGVPQLLPLDPWPHRQRLQLLVPHLPHLPLHPTTVPDSSNVNYHQCLKFVFHYFQRHQRPTSWQLWAQNDEIKIFPWRLSPDWCLVSCIPAAAGPVLADNEANIEAGCSAVLW